MNLIWTTYAWEDYLYWQLTDKKMLQKINALIKEIKRSPFDGIGKPEPLKFDLTGMWSRRINDEHRLVYAVHDNEDKIADHRALTIYQCRYHYK
ncbi:MAG TPA: Txe/YoeB family addiction module toxin [Gammaproteobacteria bacterium]|nr:Txe/YoeB family addiction module toxin [Gammaproteobacteria bacterium]